MFTAIPVMPVIPTKVGIHVDFKGKMDSDFRGNDSV
jgi:hypothetical protein